MVFPHTNVTFFFIITLLPLFSNAHFYMSWPRPRANTVVYNAPACENENTNIPNSNVFPAGSWFVPRHGKTNHNGGFDLYSLVKLSAKPSIASMISEDNIFHMECQTSNCVTEDMNQGGAFVGDQDARENSCWGSGFYWPNTPGEFTMFWYNWGSFGSRGNQYEQLPVYSNCANIRLTAGGTPSGNSTVPKCTFGGGDDSKLWDGRKPTNQQCAYKRFTTPPPNAASVKTVIAQDQATDLSIKALSKFVNIGVPSMVRAGRCAIITKPLKITDGPWHGNQFKMPPAPGGGYTYKS